MATIIMPSISRTRHDQRANRRGHVLTRGLPGLGSRGILSIFTAMYGCSEGLGLATLYFTTNRPRSSIARLDCRLSEGQSSSARASSSASTRPSMCSFVIGDESIMAMGGVARASSL